MLSVAKAGRVRQSERMAELMTGGCQCGRVRYQVEIDELDAYLCHCRMCQRATGGVAAALKVVPRAAVTWAMREPDRFRSSPIAHRGFCAGCGTPLTFEFATGGQTHMDLTVGSFDDPGAFRPVAHYGAESLHAAWLDTTGLPQTTTESNPSTHDRWIEACGKLPD